MTINVMDEYLELTKNYIIKYMKLILGYRYNKDICERLIYKYIDTRYNNYFNENIEIRLPLRKKIMLELKNLETRLSEYEDETPENINKICVFFYYILYFDKVITTKDLNKKIENIEKLRIKLLNKNEEEFKDNLCVLINNWDKDRTELLEKYESKDFELKITPYKDVKNIYRVNIKQNIKFPMIYSNIAIEKAFNTGIINEDKLYIEYYLISVRIIKEIIKQDFKKQYIVEFSETLLEKNKKIKGILNIIDNPAIQDKLSIKIKYRDYTKYKEEIQELMRNGFKIAVILDNTFEINYSNIEKLNMFSYVLLNRELEIYDELKQKNTIRNLIEI